MKNVCICLRIHQPLRLKRYRFFQMGYDHFYLDDNQNRRDFYAFCYEDLCKVRDVVESKGEQCSDDDIRAALNCDLWAPHIVAMKNIILRAKRGQLPK